VDRGDAKLGPPGAAAPKPAGEVGEASGELGLDTSAASGDDSSSDAGGENQTWGIGSIDTKVTSVEICAVDTDSECQSSVSSLLTTPTLAIESLQLVLAVFRRTLSVYFHISRMISGSFLWRPRK